MPTYTGTVETDQSPEAVFDYLAAFEHTAEWDPNCDRAERLSVGPPEVGTRFRLVFNPVGSVETELEYEIVELEPGRRVKLRGGNDRLGSEDEITVEPRGAGGATVTYQAEIGLKGVGKVLDPLVGIGFDRAGKSAEKGLAERLTQPV